MENQSYVESVKRTSIVQSFFAQVYGWMFFGLLSTGIVAYYTAHSPALLNLIFGSQITFYAFLFAPIADRSAVTQVPIFCPIMIGIATP